MSNCSTPCIGMLFSFFFLADSQISSQFLKLFRINAVRYCPICDLFPALLIIHPADFCDFRLLQFQFTNIHRLSVYKIITELIIPEYFSRKSCLKLYECCSELFQLLLLRRQSQFFLKLPQCAPHDLISGTDMSGRRDIIAAWVRILVVTPLLKQ